MSRLEPYARAELSAYTKWLAEKAEKGDGKYPTTVEHILSVVAGVLLDYDDETGKVLMSHLRYQKSLDERITRLESDWATGVSQADRDRLERLASITRTLEWLEGRIVSLEAAAVGARDPKNVWTDWTFGAIEGELSRLREIEAAAKRLTLVPTWDERSFFELKRLVEKK